MKNTLLNLAVIAILAALLSACSTLPTKDRGAVAFDVASLSASLIRLDSDYRHVKETLTATGNKELIPIISNLEEIRDETKEVIDASGGLPQVLVKIATVKSLAGRAEQSVRSIRLIVEASPGGYSTGDIKLLKRYYADLVNASEALDSVLGKAGETAGLINATQSLTDILTIASKVAVLM